MSMRSRRTLARVLWSKKKMLEWKTSSDAHRSAHSNLPGFIVAMWIGPALALGGVLLLLGRPDLVYIGPLLGLWLVSPGLAWWLSRSLAVAVPRLSDPQRLFLEKLGRRTWRFFEMFVTAEENWLAPDNFQEHPPRACAAHESHECRHGAAGRPGSVRFWLLQCRAAARAQAQDFETLARLDRHRGHFYNWYDTHSLKPLTPLYVSTVDSGNLAGHLLVLRMGLLELLDTSVLPPTLVSGLRVTLRVLLDAARGLHQSDKKARLPLVSSEVLHRLEHIETQLQERPLKLDDALTLLTRLATEAAELAGAIGSDEEVRWWASAFARTCADQRASSLSLRPGKRWRRPQSLGVKGWPGRGPAGRTTGAAWLA